MRAAKEILALSFLFVAVASPIGAPAGAAGYDLSNPASTNCVGKGLLEVPATARTFGVFSIRLRRSTGCNTVWAVVTRTDTKKCMLSGQNCAKVRTTRVRSNGTKTATAWRKMAHGSKTVFSLQLNGLNSSSFTATVATFGGKTLGTSGKLTVDANGNWTAA